MLCTLLQVAPRSSVAGAGAFGVDMPGCGVVCGLLVGFKGTVMRCGIRMHSEGSPAEFLTATTATGG